MQAGNKTRAGPGRPEAGEVDEGGPHDAAVRRAQRGAGAEERAGAAVAAQERGAAVVGDRRGGFDAQRARRGGAELRGPGGTHALDAAQVHAPVLGEGGGAGLAEDGNHHAPRGDDELVLAGCVAGGDGGRAEGKVELRQVRL